MRGRVQRSEGRSGGREAEVEAPRTGTCRKASGRGCCPPRLSRGAGGERRSRRRRRCLRGGGRLWKGWWRLLRLRIRIVTLFDISHWCLSRLPRGVLRRR